MDLPEGLWPAEAEAKLQDCCGGEGKRGKAYLGDARGTKGPASQEVAQDSPQASPSMTAQQAEVLESPRKFLRFVRDTQRNHYRIFAQRMVSAGFEVRRVVRRNNHANVWALYLRRGTVPPGKELETVKRAVCDILGKLGVKYPRKEVDALIKADRIEAFFNFAPGMPGTLSYCGGQEQWQSQLGLDDDQQG